MSNYVVYADDIKGKHVTFREEGIQFDRLIADIPSFTNRWPGTDSAGDMIDGVNSVIDLIKNCVKLTATISVTGDAQAKFDSWLNSEDSGWEVVPNSEFAMFMPYYRNVSTNKHFWGRRDEWTYVRTIRKVGSDASIPWSNYLGVDKVDGQGNMFPFPSSRDDITISDYRLPVHKGANESTETQQWLADNEVNYIESNIPAQGGMVITSVDSPGQIFSKGYVIAPSDFDLYVHIPFRMYDNGPLNAKTIGHFNKPGNFGLNALLSGNQASVSFYNFLVQTHSMRGEIILDPFCGNGASGVASILNGRKFVGVEYNADRARSAQLALEEISEVI